jgi:hypothetical protein
VLSLLLGTAAVALSIRRARHARDTRLVFEDELQADITTLGLNAE